jgi:GT2 family glycosyltransferase
MSDRQLSIIIPSLNEGKNLERTVYNLIDTIGLDNYEIIIINSRQGYGRTETSSIRRLSKIHVYDSPSRLGSPHARNFGARKASSNFLLFADAHLQFFEERWGPKVLNDLKENKDCIITPCFTDIGDAPEIRNTKGCGFRWTNMTLDSSGIPGVKPYIHEVPFAGGAFMAVEKRLFYELGEFDSGIRIFGSGDIEISLRAWLLGFRVLCDPSIRIGHKWRGVQREYTLEQIDLIHNKIRIAISHFDSKRLIKYMRVRSDALADDSLFKEALFMAVEGGALDRREMLFKRRVMTDDQFFEKFPMNGWTREDIDSYVELL